MISRQGQVSVPDTFEIGGVDEPVVWATVDNGSMAVLSRTRDIIDRHPKLVIAGTSIPDATGVIAVPVLVFERVAGVSPDTGVVFAATPDLRKQGAVGVVDQQLAAQGPQRLKPLVSLEQESDL